MEQKCLLPLNQGLDANAFVQNLQEMGPSACQSLPTSRTPGLPLQSQTHSHTSRGALGLDTSRLVPALATLPNLGNKLNLFLLPSCIPLFPDWERSLLQTRGL